MSGKKMGIAAATVAAAGVAVAGVIAASGSAVAETTTPNPSPTATTGTGSASPGPDRQAARGGASNDTPVTGDEATKVSKAVTDKDSTVTVNSVRKDPDGSYDVLATRNGTQVMFDVSADLTTITEHTRGDGEAGSDKGGPSNDTPVTGDEATKVSKAVTDKDSTVTVSSVRKDPDGSYDVLGTRNGTQVMFDVSADLTTITEHTRAGR